jgi:hypothetical protein
VVALIDRSHCNEPPASADYRPPKIICRSVTTY